MSPATGALSQLRAAVDPEAKGGEFYGPLFVNNGPPVRKPILRPGMNGAIAKTLGGVRAGDRDPARGHPGLTSETATDSLIGVRRFQDELYLPRKSSTSPGS